MKKTLFVSAIIASLAFSVQAQQPPMQGKTPQERADNQTKKLTQELSLTPDQASKVNALLLTKDQQAEPIKAKYAGSQDRSAMHAEMKPIHEQFEASLKQVLTPEQYTTYTTTKQQHGGGHGQH